MTSDITEYSRLLRKESTKSEEILWGHLRRKKLGGSKFYRQCAVPIEWQDSKTVYFADFLNKKSKLVIELDGKIHDRQKEEDAFRDRVFLSHGYMVLRFSNQDVFKRIDSVLARILEQINKR